MDSKTEFDVVIVGGGMVGATLACALKDSGLSIAMLEQKPPQDFAPDQPHDLRVSALSIASQNILTHLNAWPGIEARRCCPYRRMRVWESAGWGDTLFESDDIDRPALGYIVENRVVQLSLWQQLQGADNVSIITPAKIAAIHYAESTAEGQTLSRVELDDGRTLITPLLVGADGVQSAVCQAAGIGVHGWEYPQHALVAYVETAAGQQDITWQKFVPSGPMALLPLTGNYASLVWYNDPESVQRLLALPDAEFMDELLATFPQELGEVKRLISRSYFPLKRQHALSYHEPGLVLLGDAAHAIHPLAGQGVNIGLLDAATLAEELLTAIQKGQPYADVELLARYEKRRRNHNLLVMSAMDMIYRTFSEQPAPIKMVRNLGLLLAQKVTPAKHKAMHFAMGLEGDLPELARAG